MRVELENTKRAKEENSIALAKGSNYFEYKIERRDSSAVTDANVTFLLTRPHTVKDDLLLENISVKEGIYTMDNINITKPGRYILQLKAQIGDAIGYSELSAYLKP